jgi:hypothetical protein
MARPFQLAFSALAIVAGLAFSNAAHARPDTRAMSCEQAKSFVRQKGAVVMSTGQYTYERIVSNQSFCGWDEITWLKVAPTKDDPKCRVGYYCRPRINDGDRFRRFPF